jgi:hypothetical protein
MQHPDEGRLHEYADGALPAAERAALEAHLAQCAPCRAALGEVHALMGESDRLVATLELDPPVRLPAAPSATVITRRPWYLSRTVGLAASTLLVATVGWLVVGRRGVAPEPAQGAGAEAAKVAEAREEPAPAAPPAEAAAPPAARDLAANDARIDDPAAAQTREEAARIGGAASRRAAPEPAMPSAATGAAAMRADTPPAVPLNDLPARRPEVAADGQAVPLNDLPTTKPQVAEQAPAGVPLNDLPTRRPTVAAAAPPTGNAAPPRYAIEGLQPLSHDSLPGGGVRTVYSVNGTRVELEQGPAGTVAKRERAAATETSWTLDGTRITLRGALPTAELEALRQRVR